MQHIVMGLRGCVDKDKAAGTMQKYRQASDMRVLRLHPPQPSKFYCISPFLRLSRATLWRRRAIFRISSSRSASETAKSLAFLTASATAKSSSCSTAEGGVFFSFLVVVGDG
eukprot:5630349-Pleurochrysis_carterae.AAC.1